MENEKRLIYASDLLEQIEQTDADVFDTPPPGYCNIGGDDWGYSHDTITRLIQNAPTVDAVEVVRCGECKLWVPGRHHTGRCNALIAFHEAERYTTDEGHFCAYGERRKNAE